MLMDMYGRVHMSVRTCNGEGSTRPPGAGVTGCYKLMDMGAGN